MAKFKEDDILRYMEKLDISREEAIQLLQDDADDFIGEEGEEYEQKAKSEPTKKERSAKPKKDTKPKERKVDEEKGYILQMVSTKVNELGAQNISQKTETELSFLYNGNSYTLKLTKHRPKKS
jgi:hypothetical protein